jgi:uncharacterized membrane protein
MMRNVLLVVGILIFVLGLHWIGQGTTYFTWPANPVMDGHPTWTYIGLGSAFAGLVVIWFSRRPT